MIRQAVVIACVALCAVLAPAAAPDTDKEAGELRKLVDRIARGEDDQQELTDELIERIVAPLADAVGPLDNRPLAEQRRVHAALSRVTARLRICLHRLNLPVEDRTLFDEYCRQHPELVEELYADQPEQRIAALKRVALEPETGAGVLIVAKIDDWDSGVSDEAFNIA
ncbi:MAG: hypothetical protein JXO22_03670, partial [Phycisphaerae bacterium]|nr:hypothetical protein [Phycisphaerae bacterium]